MTCDRSQEAQRSYIEKGLPEEILCAVINNNMRCYNESTDFAEQMEESLQASYKVNLHSERCTTNTSHQEAGGTLRCLLGDLSSFMSRSMLQRTCLLRLKQRHMLVITIVHSPGL